MRYKDIHASAKRPETCTLGAAASSSRGAAAPIVLFKQSKKVVFRPEGRGVFGALLSLENTAELLYPSRVRDMLLAR